jgi:nicotinamidase-related amidase
MRDPKKDHLITPENAAFIIIDYQPLQVNSINSMRRADLVKNMVFMTRLAKNYRLPVILSTVRVKSENLPDTIPHIRSLVPDIPSYDRTTINAWEDKDFYEAVLATGRKKLIMTALWTEACLTFPTIDAIKEGFDVYPVVDAVGGTTVLAHQTALRRVQQAGAQLTSVVQLTCELQRDWNRRSTVPEMVSILEDAGAFLEL